MSKGGERSRQEGRMVREWWERAQGKEVKTEDRKGGMEKKRGS